MFAVRKEADNTVRFSGRLDAAQAAAATAALEPLTGTVTVDLSELDYISSAGLGVLIAQHSRLTPAGGALIIANPSNHVKHLFALARLDKVLTIR